jgi:hypothetical protein
MGVFACAIGGGSVVASEDDYRKKAEDCDKLAEHSTDSVLRETWLMLAEAWRKLALQVSAMKTKQP